MQRGEVKTWKGSPEFGRRIAVTVAAPTTTATLPARNLLGLELKRAAPARAYPSPPMSRSSPSPQKAQDAADHGYGPSDYPSNLQYARGGAASHHPLIEPQNQQGDQFGRSHHLERIDRMPYAYQRPADYPSRPLSYPGPNQPGLSPNATQPAYLTMASSSSAAPGFPMASSTLESKPLTSPKSQRKIKGHVASACVPCKRAHLRCDAQRPCSRCTGNGKEDACIDVQHKKRGRPRLRDDREARYDLSRPPPPHDTGLGRPLSIYSSTSTSSAGFDAPPSHEDPYRAIKSQPSEPLPPSYPDRGLRPGAEATGYGPSLSSAPRYPEAVAYLSLDLEFARVSEPFVEALAGFRLERRQLMEVVVPAERDKILGLRHHLETEQKQREPNYLPPILGRGDTILQSLGFTTEDVSRFRLDREDCLTFIGADGRARQYFVRIGLAMEGGFYFVVLLLTPPPRPPYMASTPSDRAAPQASGYYPSTAPQPAPLQDRRTHETTFPPRPGTQLPPSLNLGTHSRGSSIVAPLRAEQAHPFPYGASRSEQGSQPPQGGYQLPPIRAPSDEGRHHMHGWPGQSQQTPQPQQQYPSRDERSSRVDIGGLIEKPEGTGHMH